MGLLIDGVWRDQGFDTKSTGGRFVRKDSHFRNWVTADGAPGPSGEGGFLATPGRYHLYVSLACPWAHRSLIFRKLKKLEDIVSHSIVDPLMGDEGWVFSNFPGAIPDTVNAKQRLYEIYLLAEPRYSGRVTVPVLWDKEKKTIVNNESSEIIRMLIPPSTSSPARAKIIIHGNCAARSMRSTILSTSRSITASIARASRRRRKPMKKRSAICSRLSMKSSGDYRANVISRAAA